ncbi:YoaK family protein [Streptomyces sp. SL13]|uniref:YoaK family protein n=1 Tax=Streptantibioticus silvisoli TaxID=2705255 RepID=A0AA90H5E3_9ACTN|nr:YoaK family protein [Streptantibioticus silvisoli]MDI5974433.1 YoaK family protein [Streptantibioticus silvisoli]
MATALRDARDVLLPGRDERHGPLPPVLLALTVVTGLVNAFSYLALGHVFVANMTGNVVFMAFSLAGVPGFSLAASLVALAAFAAGALAGGRMAHGAAGHRGRVLLGAVALQTVLTLVAYAVSRLVGHPSSGGGRYALIGLLGLAMGGQNAAARRIAVPDLTTTVLTLTITGIAADSGAAGGPGSRIGRRLLSAAAMFLGALAGALVVRHGDARFTLLAAGVLLAVVTVAARGFGRSTRGWTSAG